MEEDAANRSNLNRPETSISQPLHARAAHDLYVKHLDVDLGDPDLISNHQQRQTNYLMDQSMPNQHLMFGNEENSQLISQIDN